MDIFCVLLVFFARFQFVVFQLFFPLICYSFIWNFKKVQIFFFSTKCCGSFEKFNIYFPRSLDSSPFFCKWSFYTGVQVANRQKKKTFRLISFLFNSQILEEKVEYWMEKYDRDVEQKQHELDVLKVCSLNRFSSKRVRKHSRVEKATVSK